MRNDSPFYSTMPSSQSRRKGAISALAIVVLVVTSLLITQYVRRAMMDRKQMRAEAERIQAEALVEAGIEVAKTSLSKDSAWTGTRWELPAGLIHKTKTGQVEIFVSDGFCNVKARYPANSSSPVQITRRFLLSKHE